MIRFWVNRENKEYNGDKHDNEKQDRNIGREENG
jgi:hypothetical protein